jgi:hypothetical protein
MTCYHPLLAYRSEGKIVFEKPFAYAKGFNLPCGQCIGCRLKYSQEWAVRLMHENEMHEESCFITLTMNNEYLESRENPYSLDKSEFQKFMKRLRKRYGKQIRYFHCGEYGEKNSRPHYHAIIFGMDFEDKELFSVRDEIRLYTSEILAELWPHGFVTIGSVTMESCAYVARYVCKKQKGKNAEKHYIRWDPLTGEGIPIEPEYATMSRGNNLPEDDPNHTRGIGYSWFKKYKADVYPHDYVVIKKHKIRPPRFYDKQLSEEELEKIKEKRAEELPEVIDEYNEAMDRLWVEEAVKEKRLEILIRDL